MVITRWVLFAVGLSWFAACRAPESAPTDRSVPAGRPCSPVPGLPSLRGLSAVDASTAWVSGAKGTIARTTDGGQTWQLVAPPDTAGCDFRDIEAFDANTAVAMVAGQPARVYRTTDGGAHWTVALEDRRQEAFFDGIAFAGDVGLLFGDPIDGAFCMWTTHDRGASWTSVPKDRLPTPLPGEAAFAASGSCVAVRGEPGHEQFWVATGGGPRARVLHGNASGWSAIDVPLRAGAASQGGFSIAVRGEHVVVVGGDYAAPLANEATGACSRDGGASWTAIAGGVGGFRSAVAWLDDRTLMAVGSHGSSRSPDSGVHWYEVADAGFHCLDVAGATTTGQPIVWMAGSDGRVESFSWLRGEPAADATPFTMASIFADHMVMPAEADVPVHGRGPIGAPVAVHASWGAEAKAVVGPDGRWSATLPTSGRGGPHEVTVRCGGMRRTLHDVLLGDVWLASGQSNMEMPLGKHWWSNGVRDYRREVAAADLPQLRVFTVEQAACEHAADDVAGKWVVCSPQTAGTFSATAYLFASELVRAGKTPMGVVVSAWGGTVCEAWTSEQGLAGFPEFGERLARQRRTPAGSVDQRRAEFWRAVEAATPGAATAVELPARWSSGPLRDVDGVVLYERTVELPAAWRGKACWLELGAIDDMDTVWCNGTRVGGMEADGSWNQARRYAIPAEATAGATATLRVRVVDTGGEGGFTASPEAFRLVAADDAAASLPLAGTWQQRLVGTLADLPSWPRGEEPNRPAVLWNGMIEPLLPFPFTGAIWYQGESNRMRSEQYSRLFPAMIRDWRRALGREIPFYFVQIAPYGYENDRGETAALREAQAAALALPQTGMAVTLDCGDAKDIHPIDKQPVGKRLAALALARHYGGGGPCTGPMFATAARTDDGIRLTFTGAAGALELTNEGAGFELAGADGVFVPAVARVVDEGVLLAVPPGMSPTQVRYAWAAVPAWSLRDAQQPAAPFRAAIR